MVKLCNSGTDPLKHPLMTKLLKKEVAETYSDKTFGGICPFALCVGRNCHKCDGRNVNI